VAKNSKKQSAIKEQSKASLAKARYDAAKAAKKAARTVSLVTGVNESATVQLITAVPTKPKRVRYFREMKAVQPRAAFSALPPRSNSLFARMMSKGIALPPKEERSIGPHSMV
jgi:hypothetical protein